MLATYVVAQIALCTFRSVRPARRTIPSLCLPLRLCHSPTGFTWQALMMGPNFEFIPMGHWLLKAATRWESIRDWLMLESVECPATQVSPPRLFPTDFGIGVDSWMRSRFMTGPFPKRN